MITLQITCPFCGSVMEVTVGAIDYANYCNGDLAQNCFWYLSPDEREAIISGICPSCWDFMFGAGDEEEV